MNELQRTQYLAAMGVDVFVPRLHLPHAPSPRLCDLPAGSFDHFSEINAGTEASPSKVGSVIAALREASQPQAAIVPKVLKPLEPTVAQQSSEELPEFHLALWQLPQGLLIVDSHQPGAALPIDTLLANILLANGLLDLHMPRAEIIKWPMSTQSGYDRSWTGAAAMLQELVLARSRNIPLKGLLVCGEAACKTLLGANVDFEGRCYESITYDATNCPLLILPALCEFLQQPLLKRRLWSAFSFLRAH